MQMSSDSDSEPELPLNQGNGDMVEESDELAHIHEKCDNLMAQLKALNQAAVNMNTASAVTTSPFVTPVIMPVQGNIEVETTSSKCPSEVATTADAVSESLINYLTNTEDVVVENVVEIENVNVSNEGVQLIETNVIINEAGVQQPQKSIGEMLDELPKGNLRNKHIKESNIIVSTPVFDNIVCSMKTKKTAEFKEKELPETRGKGTKERSGPWSWKVPRQKENQLPVEGRDEVNLTLQVKLWLSLGRHRVVGSTALSLRWLQLQPSQPELPKNVPTLRMGKVVVSRLIRSCHQSR